MKLCNQFNLLFIKFDNLLENKKSIILDNLLNNENIKKLNKFRKDKIFVIIILFKNIQNYSFIKEFKNLCSKNEISIINFYLIDKFNKENSAKKNLILTKIITEINKEDKLIILKNNLLKNIFIELNETNLYKELNNFLFKNKLKNKKLKESYNENVIIIKNALQLNTSISNLINLFTCFGNISKYLINYFNGFVYLKFTRRGVIEKILSNQSILSYDSTKIKINYYKLNKFRKNPFEKYFIKSSKLCFSKNRYLKNLNIKYNAPNNIIIITNVNISTNLFKFYKLINKFSTPSLIKPIINKIKNNQMIICRFNSIEQSIKIITNLHNYKYENFILRISFSFYNI